MKKNHPSLPMRSGVIKPSTTYSPLLKMPPLKRPRIKEPEVIKKPEVLIKPEVIKKPRIVGKRPSKRQRELCWRYYAGNEREKECPCCFKTKLIYTAARSWEASHIRPRAQGGSADVYNLYPLCNNCNGNMSDVNMFCYFADQPRALQLLIETMHAMFRIEYPLMYTRCQEQFYQLARHYYADTTNAGPLEPGYIPADHPVLWAKFMAYDITQNTRRVLEAKQMYDNAKVVAENVHQQYERLFLTTN